MHPEAQEAFEQDIESIRDSLAILGERKRHLWELCTAEDYFREEDFDPIAGEYIKFVDLPDTYTKRDLISLVKALTNKAIDNGVIPHGVYSYLLDLMADAERKENEFN